MLATMTEFTMCVSLPSFRLSPNGTRNRYERARLARAARDEAGLAVVGRNPRKIPVWEPEDGPVRVDVTVLLPKGQRRLDNDGLIGLLKHTIDGVQGYVVANDSQFVWGDVRWERDPVARAGMVRLTFTPAKG